MKSGEWTIEQKMRSSFLNVVGMEIKKDPTMSMQKHSNELEAHEKTVKTTIKHGLLQI